MKSNPVITALKSNVVHFGCLDRVSGVILQEIVMLISIIEICVIFSRKDERDRGFTPVSYSFACRSFPVDPANIQGRFTLNSTSLPPLKQGP